MAKLCILLLVALVVLADGYSTSGNKILDKNGKPVLIRGIARPSLEWSSKGESLSVGDYQNMKSWGANCVRLCMNQCYWLANTDGYKATIQQNVDSIKGLGMGVILDLHWSDKGNAANGCGQQNMADDRSTTFWQQVATAYANDPAVIFELYNEPHDVSWSVWLNGGDAGGFHTPGMQGLYNAVRATGANNVVIVCGLNFAYDLSGVSSNHVVGSNIAYGSHPYDFGGKQPSNWDSGFGYLAATYPIVLTEFGNFDCSSLYVNAILSYADLKGISWTAWAWYPSGCAFPSIITDWTGTPSAVGILVKASLLAASQVPSTGSNTTTASPTTTTTKPTTTTTTTKTPTTTTKLSATTTPKTPTTTTKPSTGGITVTMNIGCNEYWLAIDSVTNGRYTTVSVQFKDSSSGATWVPGVVQTWGGWAWSSSRTAVLPVSVILTSDSGASVTLPNVITSIAGSVSYTSAAQYA